MLLRNSQAREKDVKLSHWSDLANFNPLSYHDGCVLKMLQEVR